MAGATLTPTAAALRVTVEPPFPCRSAPSLPSGCDNETVTAVGGKLSWLAGVAWVAVIAGESLSAAPPSGIGQICGDLHSAEEAVFLHDQRLLRSPVGEPRRVLAPPAASIVDGIAVIEATPEIIAQPNPFDLSGKQITITPEGGGFQVQVQSRSPLTPIGRTGLPVELEDDDFAWLALPFEFPYYGETYRRLFVHSDGNLSFRWPEASSTARDYSRAAGGPPRIAPFFRDLDPSKGGRVLADTRSDGGYVISWENVPLFTATGVGSRQTFAAVLHPSGTIEFHYGSSPAADSVVGIFPGDAARGSVPVDWSVVTEASYPDRPILAEVFREERSVDEFAIAQAFFQANEDAYDQLLVFDELDFDTAPFSLAHAWSVRSIVDGIGEPVGDWASFLGSPRRLSSFVNMQSLSEYPPNPLAPIPGLESSLLTVLAHEIGHQFLAYVRFIDPETGERSRDLLGRAGAHWSFYFNTDASVLEGNSIRDLGEGASPRFETIAASQTFSALDQYLMGMREADEVPPMFYVAQPAGGSSLGTAARAPQVGVRFDGVRKEVRLEDIVAAMGERRPSALLAQRHFRFAFILLVPNGTEPSAEAIRTLNRLRTSLATFYRVHLPSRATVETDIVRMLHLSAWPAGGLIAGGTGRANLVIAEPRASDLTVHVALDDPIASLPMTVTIPAGEVEASFDLHGLAPGVTTLTAAAAEPGYDRAVAKLAVRSSAAGLQLDRLSQDEADAVAGSGVPMRFRVRDEDKLAYSGVEVEFFSPSHPAAEIQSAATGPDGLVELDWSVPLETGTQIVAARVKGSSEDALFTALRIVEVAPTFAGSDIVNAASGLPPCPPEGDAGPLPCSGTGFAPGSLVTVRGKGLASGTDSAATLLLWNSAAIDYGLGRTLPYALENTLVFFNGLSVPLVTVAPSEITFQLPFGAQGSSASLVVRAGQAWSDPVEIPMAAVQPGLFPDRVSAAGRAALLGVNLGASALATPGGVLELFGTGLGAVRPRGRTGSAGVAGQAVVGTTEAWVDGDSVRVELSALAAFQAGVYRVVVRLPEDLEPGEHEVRIAVDGVFSNAVSFRTG